MLRLQSMCPLKGHQTLWWWNSPPLLSWRYCNHYRWDNSKHIAVEANAMYRAGYIGESTRYSLQSWLSNIWYYTLNNQTARRKHVAITTPLTTLTASLIWFGTTLDIPSDCSFEGQRLSNDDRDKRVMVTANVFLLSRRPSVTQKLESEPGQPVVPVLYIINILISPINQQQCKLPNDIVKSTTRRTNWVIVRIP